eukprot:GGOE01053302.1.p1 GENE.GGOE01053302.1~~GGOE01053302.1.p1  ORF type:complete len:159 (+),score=48.10 GGOE01053302.1:480-956(+)
MLQPEDEDIFKYITNVNVEEKEDIKTGFKISVTFKENPYFTNTELWKDLTFTASNETEISQSGVCWKPGKNPAGQGDAKPGSKRQRSNVSFFTFFEAARKDNIYIANIIKDDLWPNPWRYYTGENDEDEDDDEELEEEEDLGDEEDDGDEDNDDNQKE